MPRLFVAVNFSLEINERVRRDVLEPGRRDLGPELSWVRPENLHVTLKFLGSVDEPKVPEVIEAVRRAWSGAALGGAFELTARGLGAFPNERHARVLWVGAEDPSGALGKLAARLDDELEPLGFARETRSYHAHLTVARLKAARALGQWIERQRRELFGTCKVGETVVYESRTLPTGPRYTAIAMISDDGLCYPEEQG